MKLRFNNILYIRGDKKHNAIRDIQLSKEMRLLHEKANRILKERKIVEPMDIKITVELKEKVIK